MLWSMAPQRVGHDWATEQPQLGFNKDASGKRASNLMIDVG